MNFRKKKKPLTPAEKVLAKAPRSLILPCKPCFWRCGDACDLKLNPTQQKECRQFREGKTK